MQQYANGEGGALYYYATDILGHVTGLVKGDGTLVNEYRYTPWGAPEAGYPKEGTPNPLRSMAREIDSATGLYYVRNRWYDVMLGRFLSEDPIGLAGGINPYVYAGNDPVNNTDPLGLCAQGYRRYGGTVAGLQVWFSCPRESNYRPGALIDVIPDEDALIGLGAGTGAVEKAVVPNTAISECNEYGQSEFINAVAGFGDFLTFGATDWVRDQIGGNENVNRCAGAYHVGEAFGLGAGVVLGGAVAAGKAGYSVWFRYYKNAKGVGVGISRHSKRIVSLDWHRFKKYGRYMNRPHVNGIPGHKHWPW